MKQKTKIRNLKNNKGITLIALVITVIVLIILGGVSIAMILNDDGIITKANQGKEDYTKAQMEEEMFLLISDYRIEKASNRELTLLDYLNGKKENNEFDEVIDNGDGTIKVIKNGYYTLINKETLATTEPVLVDGTIIKYEVVSFEDSKINILIKFTNLTDGISKIIKPDGQEVEGNGQKEIEIEYQIENSIAYAFEAISTKGKTAKQTIKYEDSEAPVAKFEITNTTIFSSASITADLKITDNKSGVKIDSCKWVVVTDSEEIGLDESLYTGGTLTSVTEQIVADSITEPGEYYIHLLLVDNMQNTREVISEKITIRDGYEIATADDFQNMKNDLAGNYYVTKDIDMTDYNFTTINGVFTGTIDGQGHTITGLTIKNSSNSNTGIFTYLKGPTIKNILFKDVNISSTTSYVGVFGGATWDQNYNGLKIKFEKVGLTGSMSGTGHMGSFMGKASSTPIEYKDCYSRINMNISSTVYDVGGFSTGDYIKTTVNNSYYAGTITSKNRVGPFRGGTDLTYTTNITVTDSFYNKDLFTLSVPEKSAGKGLTTGEMANSANYTNWDFKENDQDTEYTWYIDPETGYPELHF